MKILVILLLFAQYIYAQPISGSIVSSENERLAGVLVQNKQTGTYTETNSQGHFTLANCHLADTLSFKMIGYKPVTLVISSFEKLEVSLPTQTIDLSAVTVKKSIDAQEVFAKVQINTNPVNSSQDLLRLVPGLFIGQHAGGGKAEQIFLRGFDIDHGTDLNISVDGLPVNMVSHAHGQGYADLHFIIPETIDNVAYSKGSYKSEQGNFATAGSVAFHTKEALDQSTLKLEVGQFNRKRLLGLIKLNRADSKNKFYLANEYLYDDGPFVSAQKLNRINTQFQGTIQPAENQKISLKASYFGSNWSASGQIPQRAVDTGIITRFGSIDDTEGGNTSRTNASAKYLRFFNNNTEWVSQIYYTNYDFLLFSNFTFFANNPTLGDQIKQAENRHLFGAESGITQQVSTRLNWSIKAGLRTDFVRDNELSRTFQKENIVEQLNLGHVNERNAFINSNAEISLNKWLFIPGLRLDYFQFAYQNLLIESPVNEAQKKAMLSPKMSFIYQASPQNQFYLKSGYGYHSNDSRAAVVNSTRFILPRSLGFDIGNTFKPNDKILLNSTLWYLFLQQELVYVGDEGIVEPGGRTRRLGLDFSLRAQLASKLFFDSDLTYAHAHSIDEPTGSNYIPLAPIFTYTGGVSVLDWKGWSGSIKTRILGRRAATEDYSLVAKGYAVTDLNLNYDFKRFNLGFVVQNLFNTEWNETQFATNSQLKGEVAAVNEIHFTPGTPFNFRTTLSMRF